LFEQNIIGSAAQNGKETATRHNTVELVAVSNQKTSSIRRLMRIFIMNFDITKTLPIKIPQQFIMITGNVNDLRALFGFSQNRAHDIVVFLRPMKTPAHAPKINNIANQVKIVGFGGA